MLTNSDLLLAQTTMHHRELLAEADHHRLLKLAQAWRAACRARVTTRVPAGRVTSTPVAARAGTLATCGPHVAGSAR